MAYANGAGLTVCHPKLTQNLQKKEKENEQERVKEKEEEKETVHLVAL